MGLPAICRAAATIFEGDGKVLFDGDNEIARELLRLALKISDRSPIFVPAGSTPIDFGDGISAVMVPR